MLDEFEPISRAFLDGDGLDDESDHHQYIPQQWQWKVDKKIPEKIDTLLVMDNELSKQFAKQTIVLGLTPYCVYGKDIEMYKLPSSDIHVCVASKYEEPYAGIITEDLRPWIEVARRVVCVTFLSFVFYINTDNVDEQPCLIRALHTDFTSKTERLNVTILDTPNFTRGLVAGVLTLRQFLKLPGSIYCCYLDSNTIDSVNTSNITKLFSDLNIPSRPYKTVYSSDNNLFM